eukprot:Nitzschia sp. Nitz4//scaffold53_size117307//30836//31516//NITZ4_003761-RA/size117307-processed-gene-0.6-mRNA-1//1//CDS//3329554178//9094//frame0
MSGRGRGRGRAPPSGARLMLQKSAQEAGLDAGNLRNLQDITKPSLFPDFLWHSSGWQGHDPAPPTQTSANNSSSGNKRSSNIYLINKSREIHHRLQNSPYYVRPSQEMDVARYGKRPRPLDPDSHVIEHIGQAADPRYFPEELLRSKITLADLGEDGTSSKPTTLEELVAAEIKRRKALEDEGGEASDTPEAEDEEEEEVADYTQNYYASDDESGGGSGGGDEATF